MNAVLENDIPEISIVIPIFNEEDNIPELCKRLRRVLNDEIKRTYEIIFVNDGSTDNSWQLIEKYNQVDRNIKGIKLSKNFGHHSAFTAGLDHARGEMVVIMDGDLQARPEDVPLAVNEIVLGHDVIWAVYEKRKDKMVARLGGFFFWKIFQIIGAIRVPENIVFIALSSRVVRATQYYREKRRFVAGIFADIGFSQKCITVTKEKRISGEVKYTFRKRMQLAIAAITGYSNFPLRMASYLGFIFSTVSLVMAGWITVRAIFGRGYLLGWPSVIVSIFLLSGIQLIVLGFIGEYMGVIIDEVKNRPLYLVESKIPEDRKGT